MDVSRDMCLNYHIVSGSKKAVWDPILCEEEIALRLIYCKLFGFLEPSDITNSTWLLSSKQDCGRDMWMLKLVNCAMRLPHELRRHEWLRLELAFRERLVEEQEIRRDEMRDEMKLMESARVRAREEIRLHTWHIPLHGHKLKVVNCNFFIIGPLVIFRGLLMLIFCCSTQIVLFGRYGK
jgi:hypothetical protein